MPKSKNPQRVCRKCGKFFHCKTNTVFCNKCRTETRICANCGKEFVYKRSLKKDVKTCSMKCGQKTYWKDVEQQRASRRPPCANCGKPITRRYIGYGKNKPQHMFCNKKCYGEWRSKNVTGDFHPRWTGGYKRYYGASWFNQRALARARDGVCQRCGKTPQENGKLLDVHHIIPFRKFGIQREQDANALNNLISYCKTCHQRIEWDEYESHRAIPALHLS